MSFLANKTVSGHFKSSHSDFKKRYNNIAAKYFQDTRKKKKVIQKTKTWDLMVWCFDEKLYKAWQRELPKYCK